MAGRFSGLVKPVAWLPALVALGVLAWAPAARPQAPPLIFPERVSKVTVTPAVADTGVAREIRITGTWAGCWPVGARVAGAGLVRQSTLVVQLVLPMTLMPCPLTFQPYTVTTTYTPGERGISRLLVLNVDGDFLGEALLDTRAASDDRSAFNITGMWYDPQSNGSGLTFVHSRVNDNAVFGTWYVYDSSGKPRWYTIQDAVWKSQGRVMEGWLYQTSAVANCSLLFIYGCPASIDLLVVVGRARVTITGNGTATVEALTTGGTVIFSSNVIRAEI
ncbi:MAG: hypothetical protein IPP88_02240 [Betaproteobacteria bacterium]|nr:hypothetical protein [Betaproteobacteria bacterium]